MKNCFLLSVALAACAHAPAPVTPAMPAAAVQAVPATSPPGQVADVLTAAEQAQNEATDYVASKQSQPDRIGDLTQLVRNLDAAIKALRASRQHGRYAPDKIAVVRGALGALRAVLDGLPSPDAPEGQQQ